MSASAGTKVFTTTNTDGKVTFHVTTSATLPPASGNSGLLPQQPPTPKKTVVGINSIATRGVPPPVPPNKPVIPPKKSGGGSVQGSGTGQISNTPSCSFPVVISYGGHSRILTTLPDYDSNPPAVESIPQGVKFGITISKDKIQITNSSSSTDAGEAKVGLTSALTMLHELDRSCSPPLYSDQQHVLSSNTLERELDDFEILLSSMMGVSPSGLFGTNSHSLFRWNTAQLLSVLF